MSLTLTGQIFFLTKIKKGFSLDFQLSQKYLWMKLVVGIVSFENMFIIMLRINSFVHFVYVKIQKVE